MDDIANMTAVPEYYNHDFWNLTDILVKNIKKLRYGYDPRNPINYRHLKEWYEDSMDKLQPFMSIIEAEDMVIEQIVYRLYGLTEEEMVVIHF